MSGLEIAGVVLGAFPLILAGLQHWPDVHWAVRREHKTCCRRVEIEQLLFKANLKKLLIPALGNQVDVDRLASDPGGTEWQRPDLQQLLQARLSGAYKSYLCTMCQLNDVLTKLSGELCLDNIAAKTKMGQDPESGLIFRMRFHFKKRTRDRLFRELEKCNEELGKLLDSSDAIAALEGNALPLGNYASVTEAVICDARRRSECLYKALERSWQCACQEFHVANLRLEHRTRLDTSFELILKHEPSHQIDVPWTWRELRCVSVNNCSKRAGCPRRLSHIHSTSQPRKKVKFTATVTSVPEQFLQHQEGANTKLCQALCLPDADLCMGVIAYRGESYHLHPFTPDAGLSGRYQNLVTFDQLLSEELGGHVRRQLRYAIALDAASSFAQLQSTPWLRSGLHKNELVFFASNRSGTLQLEPFISSTFAPHDADTGEQTTLDKFILLGILLLELCFGRRLEDDDRRNKTPAEDAKTRLALDLVAALKWLEDVGEVGGEEYASAVRWCFIGSTTPDWEKELVRKVIKPLEMCQKHFEATMLAMPKD